MSTPARGTIGPPSIRWQDDGLRVPWLPAARGELVPRLTGGGWSIEAERHLRYMTRVWGRYFRTLPPERRLLLLEMTTLPHACGIIAQAINYHRAYQGGMGLAASVNPFSSQRSGEVMATLTLPLKVSATYIDGDTLAAETPAAYLSELLRMLSDPDRYNVDGGEVAPALPGVPGEPDRVRTAAYWYTAQLAWGAYIAAELPAILRDLTATGAPVTLGVDTIPLRANLPAVADLIKRTGAQPTLRVSITIEAVRPNDDGDPILPLTVGMDLRGVRGEDYTPAVASACAEALTRYAGNAEGQIAVNLHLPPQHFFFPDRCARFARRVALYHRAEAESAPASATRTKIAPARLLDMTAYQVGLPQLPLKKKTTDDDIAERNGRLTLRIPAHGDYYAVPGIEVRPDAARSAHNLAPGKTGKAVVLEKDRIDARDWYDWLSASAAADGGGYITRLYIALWQYAQDNGVAWTKDGACLLLDIDAHAFMRRYGWVRGPQISYGARRTFHDTLMRLLRGPVITTMVRDENGKPMLDDRGETIQIPFQMLALPQCGSAWSIRECTDGTPDVRRFSVVLFAGVPRKTLEKIPAQYIPKTLLTTGLRRHELLMLQVLVMTALRDIPAGKIKRNRATGHFFPVHIPLADVWGAIPSHHKNMKEARRTLRRWLREIVTAGLLVDATMPRRGDYIAVTPPDDYPRFVHADRENRKRIRDANARTAKASAAATATGADAV